jgi:5-methylthioribose kinase
MRLDDANLADYLEQVGLRRSDEPIGVIGVGDGNINFVRRIRIGADRTLVVKQARAALERFPEYEVSTERIEFERRYGQVVHERADDVAGLLPRLLHHDAAAKVLVMEDVGPGPRLDAELGEGRIPHDALRVLGEYLGRVHVATADHAQELAAEFHNDEMRALHGEHIFSLPYEPNDFPISAELRAKAEKQLSREGVRERIRALRGRYYEERQALVHGDVQAGNIVLQQGRPRLLDAEIAHVGDPMFDLGTALAHLEVHRPAAADPSGIERGVQALLEGYRTRAAECLDADRARHFAAVEVMRRAIGAARLTCLASDEAAARALSHAVKLLLT